MEVKLVETLPNGVHRVLLGKADKTVWRAKTFARTPTINWVYLQRETDD